MNILTIDCENPKALSGKAFKAKIKTGIKKVSPI